LSLLSWFSMFFLSFSLLSIVCSLLPWLLIQSHRKETSDLPSFTYLLIKLFLRQCLGM
jgi:hypothetical protein